MASVHCLFLAVVLLLAPAVVGHQCAHDLIAAGHEATSSVQELVDLQTAAGPSFATRALGTAGIRIKFDTTLLDNDAAALTCDSVGTSFEIGVQASPVEACGPRISTGCTSTCTAPMVFTPAMAATITAALPLVSTMISDLINVVSPAASIAFPSTLTSCGSDTFGKASVPVSYISTPTTGADLIIFLTRRPTLGGIQSYGIECLYDQLGRPVVGHINLNPINLNAADLNGTRDRIAHELVHVLGFSSTAYSRFITSSGKRYSETLVRSRATSFGNFVQRFEGPRIAGLAKQYWDCAAASGVELENGGGLTIASSHWEKRQMFGELMSAYDPLPAPVLSIFTLALLEDSGWYATDFDAAPRYTWGYRGGCAFYDGQCSDWTGYFCAEDGATGCTPDGSAKGTCTITEWTGIPLAYQYFGNDVLGGEDLLADFCPFYVQTAASSCAVSSPSNAGELFGPSSRCFQSTLVNVSGAYTGALSPRCYNFECAASTQFGYVLTVTANGAAGVVCPIAGGSISVPGLVGNIICPASKDVCAPVTLTNPPRILAAAGWRAPCTAVLLLVALVAAALL